MKHDNKDNDAGTTIAIFLDKSSFVIIMLKALFVSIRYHHDHLLLLPTSLGEASH